MIYELLDEIHRFRPTRLKTNLELTREAIQLVEKMAVVDSINMGPPNSLSAKSVGDDHPWKIVRDWGNSEKHNILFDPSVTKIGIATRELNGKRYWCVLTK
jgi:hypothetical protein